MMDPAVVDQLMAQPAGAIETLIADVPDEFYRWVNSQVEGFKAQIDAIVAQATEVFNARPTDATRKELAAYFNASEANRSVLFRMLEGKPYDDITWRQVRPAASGVFKIDEAP
jgi:DNA-binding SARP family transcriptional activator